MEYTSSGSSWGKALRRAISALRLPSPPRRGWSIGVPLIALSAGFLFTVSATTANGTVLREDRRVELSGLVDAKSDEVSRDAARAEQLQAEVDAATSRLGETDQPIAAQQARAEQYLAAAGFTAVHGPGVTVRLDDSDLPENNNIPNSELDNYVIHQQDVQAVVNALWAGGAEAMTIMNVRILSTSAVRCVGNSLVLNGRRYTPVFEIRAIGDPARLRAALDASQGVIDFVDATRTFGLGYSVTDEVDILAPAYRGSVDLPFAEVPE